MFAANAALALTVSLLLQMTLFLAVLTLDLRRQGKGRLSTPPRLDMLCCLAYKEQGAKTAGQEGAENTRREPLLARLVKNYLSPNVTANDLTRAPLLVIFAGLLFASLSLWPRMDIGLDQRLSMPSDSYLLDYFNAQASLLRVGAPYYLVVDATADLSNYDLSVVDEQNLICGRAGCAAYSLVNLASERSKKANATTGKEKKTQQYLAR